MGLFNRLRLAGPSTCGRCGHTYSDFAQFKWGECSINHYGAGDTLEWGGRDRGRPVSYVIVGAIREGHCPQCGARDEVTEWFDVHIKDGTIVSIEPAPPGRDWDGKRSMGNDGYGIVVEE